MRLARSEAAGSSGAHDAGEFRAHNRWWKFKIRVNYSCLLPQNVINWVMGAGKGKRRKGQEDFRSCVTRSSWRQRRLFHGRTNPNTNVFAASRVAHRWCCGRTDRCAFSRGGEPCGARRARPAARYARGRHVPGRVVIAVSTRAALRRCARAVAAWPPRSAAPLQWRHIPKAGSAFLDTYLRHLFPELPAAASLGASVPRVFTWAAAEQQST